MDSAQETFRAIYDAVYWFDAALARFRRELECHPQTVRQLAGQARDPLDVLSGLDRIRAEVNAFAADLRNGRDQAREQRANEARKTSLADVGMEELRRLSQFNQRWEEIAARMEDLATEIVHGLKGRLNDPADLLLGYEIDARFDFYLDERDRGYSEDGENTVARLALRMSDRSGQPGRMAFVGRHCPQGCECFPAPHGVVFHELHCQRASRQDMAPLALRDLLRIGFVGIDLVVRCQFGYDINTGRWEQGCSSPVLDDNDEAPPLDADAVTGCGPGGNHDADQAPEEDDLDDVEEITEADIAAFEQYCDEKAASGAGETASVPKNQRMHSEEVDGFE